MRKGRETVKDIEYKDSAIDALKSIYNKRVGSMQGYQIDFLSDAYALGQNPFRVSFLHVVDNLGTYIEILYPADKYPKAGEQVPYLFAQADREKLLAGKGSTITYAAKGKSGSTLYYYDGEDGSLKVVDFDTAETVVQEYKKGIRQIWQEEGKEHA